MGKSTAERLLRERGVPVIDTDQLAREVVLPGTGALDEIVAAFGPGVVDAQGTLRRDQLGRIVFADPVARGRLEGILHPRIRARWRDQFAAWEAQGKHLAVVVIPLLYETGAEAELACTFCVACGEATQRQRLLARGWSEEEIRQRLAAQWPIDRKVAAADVVIWNEAPLPVLDAQLGLALECAVRRTP